MKLTNRHNLPKAFEYAAERLNADYAASRGNAHFTVTELCAPPQIVLLRRRHADQLTEDVSDRIWAIMGSALHAVLAKAAEQVPGELTERRLSAPIYRVRISGAFDSLRLEEGTLSDFKLCSHYAIEDGPRKEWVEQLNMLSWLVEHNTGEVPQRLTIIAILRDRIQARSKASGYPQQDVVELDVPRWHLDYTRGLIEQRLEILQSALKANDEDLPKCTREQRWAKAEMWAVKRKGGAKALPGGLRFSLEDAQAFAAGRDEQTQIEHRPGENTRCERYCPVRQVCQQRARAQEAT